MARFMWAIQWWCVNEGAGVSRLWMARPRVAAPRKHQVKPGHDKRRYFKIVTFFTITGVSGHWPGMGPPSPVGTLPMASTTSMPPLTWPNTA